MVLDCKIELSIQTILKQRDDNMQKLLLWTQVLFSLKRQALFYFILIYFNFWAKKGSSLKKTKEPTKFQDKACYSPYYSKTTN